MGDVWELVLRLDARVWAALAVVGWSVVVALIVPAVWRKRRYRHSLSAMRRRGILAQGVRQDTAVGTLGVGVDVFQAITDDCLRGGYPLQDAQWIAQRACELGGDEKAVKTAKGQVDAARGTGW